MVSTSLIEDRRKAWCGFANRSANARISAKELWRMGQESPSWNPGQCRKVVFHEAFQREAAISLELALKAVFAKNFNSAPPFTHDLVALWSRAKLPKVTKKERATLLHLKHILYWSGRYLAPKSQDDLDKEIAEMNAVGESHSILVTFDMFDGLHKKAMSDIYGNQNDLLVGMTDRELSLFLDPDL